MVRFADSIAARLQEAAVCVSPELTAQFKEHFPRIMTEVIENGIDTDELSVNSTSPIDASLLGGGFRVGLAGRMVDVKRPDLFVTTAYELNREHPGRYSFHLFGDGPKLCECEQFVARHALKEQVRFLGFRKDLPAWLAHMDALILCSDHEGLPMVLLEAMALGVPVIAHATGGIPYVLRAGEYGVLVHEHSTRGYSNALRAVADNPEETAKRARRAREHVQARYSIAGTAARYIELYRGLLSAHARPR
jgi:glycosyltransferase involved in cell wall biosynthesis